MLVVRVEIWPFGNADARREIGRTYIWNDGTGDIERGNYNVAVLGEDGADVIVAREPILAHAIAKGTVAAYPRGPRNLWPLVRDALRACKLRKGR